MLRLGPRPCRHWFTCHVPSFERYDCLVHSEPSKRGLLTNQPCQSTDSIYVGDVLKGCYTGAAHVLVNPSMTGSCGPHFGVKVIINANYSF